jgi:hypothetical protein
MKCDTPLDTNYQRATRTSGCQQHAAGNRNRFMRKAHILN